MSPEFGGVYILCSDGSRADLDENTRTHSEIRHEKLRQLQEQRPTLTDNEIDTLLETWDIIQENMDRVGTDMFVR